LPQRVRSDLSLIKAGNGESAHDPPAGPKGLFPFEEDWAMAANAQVNSRLDSSSLAVGLIMLAVLILALSGAANAIDPAFRAHAWMFAAAAFLGLAGLLTWHEGPRSAASRFDPTYYEDGVVKAGIVATMFWGIAGFLAGLVAALQLTWPNLFYFPELGWTDFGRCTPRLSCSRSAETPSSLPRSTSCSARAVRDWPAACGRGSSSGAISSSSSLRRPAICLALPRPRNTPSRNGMQTYG